MKPATNLPAFLNVSEALTGFGRVELESTGMAAFYCAFIDEQFALTPSVVSEFYTAAAAALRLSGNERDNAVRQNLLPSSCYNGLAVTIINLWYLGTYNGNPVSPQAYVQGLIWKTAHTHPQGALQPGFGSWALDPTAISSLQNLPS